MGSRVCERFLDPFNYSKLQITFNALLVRNQQILIAFTIS